MHMCPGGTSPTCTWTSDSSPRAVTLLLPCGFRWAARGPPGVAVVLSGTPSCSRGSPHLSMEAQPASSLIPKEHPSVPAMSLLLVTAEVAQG